MMMSKSLNPSAPSFTIPGGGCVGAPGSPSATATTVSSASTYEFDVSHLAFKGDDDNDPLLPPGPPSNTPVDNGHGSTHNNSAGPKVAGSLGHGWKSTFPLATFPNPTNANKSPNGSLMTQPVLTSPTPTTYATQGNATTFLRTSSGRNSYLRHRSKSPSVPDNLLSDNARRGMRHSNNTSPTYPAEKAKRALEYLRSNGKHNDQSSDKDAKEDIQDVTYSSSEEDLVVDFRQPQNQQSPAFYNRIPPATPTRSTFDSEPTSPVSPTRFLSSAFATQHPRDEGADPNHFVQDIGEGRNIYLPDLSEHVTEDLLHKIGQSFGRVVSVKVAHCGSISPDLIDMLPDNARRGTRTYAFVMFDAPLPARKFMEHMHKNDIAVQYGKETPHLKQKALEDPHSSNLYVAEIPLDATEKEMRDLFYPGIISSLRFLTDDQGNRRGTAMVRLQSRTQAEEAIRRLDLSVIMRGCVKALQVRIADSENQKLLKRQTPRPSELHDSCRRPSISPTTPSPPRSIRATPYPEELDDDALVEQYKAYEEELRRRESLRRPGDSRRTASNLVRASEMLRGLSIAREPIGPGTPPGFDSARRRFSDDSSQIQIHKTSRRPSLDAGLGRGYDTSPLSTKISRKPSLDVTIGRAEYSPLGAKGHSRWGWGSNDSQEQLGSGSGSDSVASSMTSLASWKEAPRYRDSSDVFRDQRMPF